MMFLSFFLSGCSEKMKKQINSSPFPVLFNLGYEFRNDNVFKYVCNILNDSINLKESVIRFESAIITDPDKETAEFGFVFDNEIVQFDIHNSIIISINDENILLNNSKKIEPYNIKKIVKEFISEPDSICNCYETVTFDFFGEVEFPQRGILLSVSIKDKKGLTVNEWKKIYNIIHEIISVYKEKRNEISMGKWGVKYDLLDFEKKIAVTEFSGFLMFIYINKDY